MGPSSSDGPPVSHGSDADGLRPTNGGRYVALFLAAVRGLWAVVLAGVRPVAFWGAVVLPLLYLPSLYGFGQGAEPFVELVAVHAVTIVFGHGHTPFWSQ